MKLGEKSEWKAKRNSICHKKGSSQTLSNRNASIAGRTGTEKGGNHPVRQAGYAKTVLENPTDKWGEG